MECLPCCLLTGAAVNTVMAVIDKANDASLAAGLCAGLAGGTTAMISTCKTILVKDISI